MKPKLSEYDERYQFDHIEVISRMGDILSEILTMKDSKLIYDKILRSIHDLFNFTEIALKIIIEGTLRLSYASTYGFDEDIVKKMMMHEYPENWMDQEIKEEYRITKNGYLINGEEYVKFLLKNPDYDPMEMYDKPGDLTEEREFPEQWHEADFFDFIIYDSAGKIVGYLELNDHDKYPDYLPPREVLEAIDLFSQLVGIVNRIWIQQEETWKKREIAEILSSFLSSDLSPVMNEASNHISTIAKSSANNKGIMKNHFDRSKILIKQSLRILDSVMKMIEIENHPESIFTVDEINRLLNKWELLISRRRRGLKIDISRKETQILSKVDVRFNDLLTAFLDVIDILSNEEVNELQIKIFDFKKEDKMVKIGFTSDRIREKAWKQIRPLVSSRRSRQSSLYRGYLPMYIIHRIIKDYNGQSEVEFIDDRYWLVLYLQRSFLIS